MPTPPSDEGSAETVHIDAVASGEARVYIAARDVVHNFYDGVRSRRRLEQGTAVDECPYPGLDVFARDQARWFFGRDQLIADLLDRLDRRRVSGGLQMVVAPSGTGKSSVLRAGLLPSLEDGALPGSRHWPQTMFTPTATPLRELAERLKVIAARLTGVEPHQVDDHPGGGHQPSAESLVNALRSADLDSAGRAVIVVDQFEELFTLCDDESQRTAFIDLLTRLATPSPEASGPIAFVVIGLRADFYPACTHYPQLRAALQQNQLVLGSMSPDELREAIRFPAQDVGLDIEEGLVELLLRDLGVTAGDQGTQVYEAGRLPLLAHALRRTWQRRHGATLTVAGYQSTGGIREAIAATAEEAFAGLDTTKQTTARLLFLQLISFGDKTDDTRRRLSRTEVTQAANDPHGMAAVIDAFTRERLLTHHRDTIEITHEALLHTWPRLRGWMKDDRAGHVINQRLNEAAVAWQRAGRDSSLLYRGARLQTTVEWADTPSRDDLSPAGREFLSASTRQQRRNQRLRRSAIAVLTALTLIASAAAVLAIQSQREAERQRDLATFNRILAEADRLRDTDTSLSAQLTLVAHRMRPGDETRSRLITSQHDVLSSSLTGPRTNVRSVALSPDGRTLASGGDDGSIQLWKLSGTAEPVVLGAPLTGHAGNVMSLAFTPDSSTLASAGWDRSVRLWDVTDPAKPSSVAQISSPLGSVLSIAFKSDGRTLAAATSGAVLMWDIAEIRKPNLAGFVVPKSNQLIWSVALSPDGRTLATGGQDATILLWDITDPAKSKQLGKPLLGKTGPIYSVAFSADGATLASGGFDQTVRLWKVTDPRKAELIGQPLTGHTDIVNSVSFSPDGHTMASAGYDGTIRLWNVADLDQPRPRGQPLVGHSDTVRSVAFSPDGHTLASGGDDTSVRLWSLPLSEVIDKTKSVSAATFSPDGKVVATANYDMSVRLWDVTDPAKPTPLGKPLTGHTSGIQSVSFSPDGRLLASGGLDATVRLWDVADPSRPEPLGRPLSGHSQIVNSVAFSPDGTVLATGSSDGSTRLWDVKNPADARPLGEPITEQAGGTLTVVFSPRGGILATADLNRTVWLWDVSHPARPSRIGRPLHSDTTHNLALAFSPDGRILAGGDRTIRLWNITDPANPVIIGENLTGHTHAVTSLAFSSDMRTLASSSADRSVQLWNIADPTRPVPIGQPLTGHTNHVSSVSFSPDGQTLVTSSDDRSFRLWTLRTDQIIERVCRLTRNALNPSTWRRYVGPDSPYERPCR